MKNIKLLLIGLFLIPIFSFAQEFTLKLTPEQEKRKKELEEEQAYLNFQKHFFKAIYLKAKEDYSKAIAALEDCKQIYPDDPGMNFEFAKNYYLLKDYENAIYFNKKTLEFKPDVYVFEHLKNIYRSQQDIPSAIEVQKQIIILKPERKAELIILYIANKEYDKAKKLLLELESKNQLVDNSTYYKRLLFPKRKTQKPFVKNIPSNVKVKSEKPLINSSIEGLRRQFTKNKKYKILKQLLVKEDEQNQYDLLAEDSKNGLELFPAQPYLYYLQGKSQNKLHKYKDALLALQAGLDFIIDDNKLQANFYEQLEQAYLGLGNNKQATKYANKALSLRRISK